MRKIIKHTDLSAQKPGPRAIVAELPPQEGIEITVPVVGGHLTLKALMNSESSFSGLVATVTLASSGCVCAFTLYSIGLPRWAAACALLLPTVIYVGFFRRRTAGERTRKHCREI